MQTIDDDLSYKFIIAVQNIFYNTPLGSDYYLYYKKIKDKLGVSYESKSYFYDCNSNSILTFLFMIIEYNDIIIDDLNKRK